MRFAFVLLVLVVVLAGCVGEAAAPAAPATVLKADCSDTSSEVCVISDSGVEKLEVIHFHGTHQCESCITVGDYAEETVKTYFSEELGSGKITFAHVNGELPENAALVKKYGATGSSLWIGVYDETGFHAEQNINVWYKINDKKAYMNYLKGVLEEKLEGS